MSRIVVEHQENDRFTMSVGRHALTVDQPVSAGGDDAGPTPTELFVAGLASCVGFYAGRFLRRHGISASGLRVECDFAMSEGTPARVSAIDLRVVVPAGVPASRMPALQRMVEHCTVHNSIVIAPDIRIAVDAGEQVA
jgi:uncharacterized OsmC-like protein